MPLTNNLSSVVLARHTSNIMEMYYDRDFAVVRAEKVAALVAQTWGDSNSNHFEEFQKRIKAQCLSALQIGLHGPLPQHVSAAKHILRCVQAKANSGQVSSSYRSDATTGERWHLLASSSNVCGATNNPGKGLLVFYLPMLSCTGRA